MSRFVYVWDTTSRRILYKLPGHAGSVNEVAFHPEEPIGEMTLYLSGYSHSLPLSIECLVSLSKSFLNICFTFPQSSLVPVTRDSTWERFSRTVCVCCECPAPEPCVYGSSPKLCEWKVLLYASVLFSNILRLSFTLECPVTTTNTCFFKKCLLINYVCGKILFCHILFYFFYLFLK